MLPYEVLLTELRRADDGSESYGQALRSLESRYQKGVEMGREKPDAYAIQNWAVSAQGMLLYAAGDAFVAHYHQILEGSYPGELLEESHLNEVLGDIALRHVFTSAPILSIEIAANRILTKLLTTFAEAVLLWDTDIPLNPVDRRLITLISENYKTIYTLCSKDKSPEEKLYLRLLLVTDFICGMTDSYAQDLFGTLQGQIQ